MMRSVIISLLATLRASPRTRVSRSLWFELRVDALRSNLETA